MSSPRYIKRLVLVVFIAIFLLPAALTCGCDDRPVNGVDEGGTADSVTHAEKEIPLTTLAQGVTSDYGRFDEMPIPEDAPPEGFVITNDEEYQLLISLAFLRQQEFEVDFEDQMVIAAMQGPKNTGGYAISIMRASQTGNQVRVEVEVVEPEPGSMTFQTLTSPYHLVTAERPAFEPAGELVFLFVDQNDAQFTQITADI
ncbi:MAG: protease complex subunit PrcB family protein [Actinomycetota bacterium]|nr:protease complex subunit PrcB family protein [Actinomycetota bacterium]